MENNIPFVVFEACEARHERREKRLIAIIIILIAVFILSFGAYAGYSQYMWSQYEFVDETVEIDTHEGPANYMGENNSGDIVNYGQDTCYTKSEKKKR